jgi:biotin transport system permease protein
MGWDARIKVLLAFFFGIVTWRTGWPGLALYALALVYLASTLSGFLAANRRAARAFIAFAAIWTAVKFGLDIFSGVTWLNALRESALLGTRLMVVLLIGLVLAQSTSPQKLGMALSWLLRPVLGRRAWKTALALALMIHFLPLAWFASDGVGMGIKTRGPGITKRKRLILFPTALLSRLALKTWSQTLAVSARGLDRPEAWRPDFPAATLSWLMGLSVAAAGLAVSYL